MTPTSRNRAETPAQASASRDRKSTRLNSSHMSISYAVFCLKKKTHPYHPLSLSPSARLPPFSFPFLLLDLPLSFIPLPILFTLAPFLFFPPHSCFCLAPTLL